MSLAAIPGVAPAAAVNKRQLNLTYELILPKDPKLARMGESLQSTTDLAWSAETRGQQVDVTIKSQKIYNATFLPVPPSEEP